MEGSGVQRAWKPSTVAKSTVASLRRRYARGEGGAQLPHLGFVGRQHREVARCAGVVLVQACAVQWTSSGNALSLDDRC